ncbi:MAG: hypothetical protein RIB60_05970 [Phycisphaerales bacterium]
MAISRWLVVGFLIGVISAPAPAQEDVRLERLRALIDRDETTPDPTRGSLFTEDWVVDTPEGADIGVQNGLIDLFGNLIVPGAQGSLGVIRSYNIAGASGPPSPQWTAVLPGGEAMVSETVAADLDGFYYAHGRKGPGQFGEEEVVVKVTPGGGVVWQSSVSANAGFGGLKVKITPDSAPIVSIGDFPPVSDGSEDALVLARLNQFTGGVEWESPRFTDAGTQFISSLGGTLIRTIAANDFALDSRGDVCVMYYRVERGDPCAANNAIVIKKLNGFSGEELWTQTVCRSRDYDPAVGTTGAQLLVGSGDRVFVMGEETLSCFAPDGAHLWTTGLSVPVEFYTMALDQTAGAVFLLGANIDTRRPVVACVDANGTVSATRELAVGDGSFLRSGRIEVGRFGNPYIAAGVDNLWVGKLNKDGLGTIWEKSYTGFDNAQVHAFLVDAGDNIIVRALGQVGSTSTARLLRLSQPNLFPPTKNMACPNLVIENRSIWAPGVGLLEEEDDFFNLGWNIDEGDKDCYETFLFGEFGGGGRFATAGNISLGYKVELNGGSADIHLPLDLTWTVPSQTTIRPDSVGVPVTSEWRVNDAARLVSCFTPEFNAGITGSLSASLYADVQAKAFQYDSGWNLLDEVLLDEAFSLPKDYLPGLNVQDLLGFAGLPQTGEWFKVESGAYSLQVKTPQMLAQGSYNASSNGFGTFATDRFMTGEANVTEIFLEANPQLPPAGFCYPDDFPGAPEGYGRLEVALLQAFLQLNLDAKQGITVDQVQPKVTYDIRYPATGATHSITQNLGEDLLIDMSNTTEAFVTPRVWATMRFKNKTDIAFVPGVRWETLRYDGAFQFKGWDLFEFDDCVLCAQQDLPPLGDLNVFDNSWTVDIAPIVLAPFVVAAQPFMQPILVASSRSKLDLIIYDQTSPRVSSFNLAANGISRMLLYGDNFSDDPGNPTEFTRAKISFQGREEELAISVLSSRTALLEIPNRFRLMPGVARIWLENDEGCSAAIDIPIEYPVPRLDTVNPNLWAADPSLNDVPVQVIDKKTPLGTDTFIARRDYYIKMRDDLWNSSTAGGMSATDYFPAFNFNEMPGFPSVLFGGDPLPRFVQPVDNGIHNLRLAHDDYDSPRLVDVMLCNPGPGGGMSETVVLDIAAPIPVASSVRPSEIEPGGELEPGEDGFVLVVGGPKNVPYLNGFEEPKSGNFNAASKVIFDGFELDTTYISSSELRAFVPVWAVQHPGNVQVTVVTPSNGTYYFEELWTDSDFDGVPDRTTDSDDDTIPDDLVLQDIIPSGGESAPMLFRIRYRLPEIDYINPAEVAAGSPAFDGAASGARIMNISIVGENFREGATVLINGAARETEFVSRGLLNAALLPADIAVMGPRTIAVLNPGSDQPLSEGATLSVTAPEPRMIDRGNRVVGP